jgi:hypothetical protein
VRPQHPADFFQVVIEPDLKIFLSAEVWRRVPWDGERVVHIAVDGGDTISLEILPA